jgi:RNA polymerase sigma factor (sigma-70 family)
MLPRKVYLFSRQNTSITFLGNKHVIVNFMNITETMTKYEYLIIRRARKYQKFSNYEDLLQEGRLALLMAIKSYDPNQGELAMWADYYIKTRLSRKANQHSVIQVPIKHFADKSNPIINDTNYEIDKITTESFESVFLKKEQIEALYSAISLLDKENKKIIYNYLKEISNKKQNISRYTIIEITKILKRTVQLNTK